MMMNKKIICILIIFSLLAVSLTSISANETVADKNMNENDEGDVPVTGEEPMVTMGNSSINSEEENVTDNNTENEKGNDIVVPSNPEDLSRFNVILNLIDDSALESMAIKCEIEDNDTFSDVIVTLNNHDREKLLSVIAELEQDKIDEFFKIFLNMFDDYYSIDDDDDDDNDNDYSDYQHSIKNSNTAPKFVKSNGQTNNVKKVTPKNIQSDDETFNYKGNTYYTIYDYIMGLIHAYENGKISYKDFIDALELYDIDTSKIVVDEFGIITWGNIHIIPLNDNGDNIVMDDNAAKSTVNDNVPDEANNIENIPNENTDSNNQAEINSTA